MNSECMCTNIDCYLLRERHYLTAFDRLVGILGLTICRQPPVHEIVEAVDQLVREREALKAENARLRSLLEPNEWN